MVKKVISVNVDLDALTVAQSKVNNISAYVNECFVALAGKTPEDRNKEQLEAELKDLQALQVDTTVKIGICKQSLKDVEESKILRLKEQSDEEQYKRWKCGVSTCHHLNYMDSLKCNNCGLPTRNDSKTTIVNIKEE